MKILPVKQQGSTLVVTIAVTAGLLVLLAIAVEYTTQISRNTQRSRKTALAMEIADGHLETLFTNWRNIYRTTWVSTFGINTGGTDYSVAGTNFFNTSLSAPGPAPTAIPNMTPAATPPVIPTPPPSMFPTAGDYTVTQYRIQAVDPMVTLDANGNALVESGSKGGGTWGPMASNAIPPAGYGPNTAYNVGFPYSYYYLASVDVQVPTLKGNVTAKVRRVFEKKFDLPWSYALFYVDDLEMHPSSTFTITGPVHTNGGLYISTSNFTAANPTYSGTTPFPTSGRIEYGSDYVNGYAPGDPRSTNGASVSTPNFAKSNASLSLSDCPPSQVSPYMPFGWNLTLSAGNASTNDDSYREIVEMPANPGAPDALQSVRYYNQARIKVTIDKDNLVKIYRPATGSAADQRDPSKNVECTASSSGNDLAIYQLITGSLTKNLAMKDAKENVNVRIAELDISKIQKAIDVGNGALHQNQLPSGISAVSGFTFLNAVIYIADTTTAYNSDGTRNVLSSPQALLAGSPVSTEERAIRLINGSNLPTTGLTIVTPNPIYIKGNYNTGGSPPSNTTATSSPVVSGYTRKASAVVADAINVLSGNWTDANSTQSITSGGYSSANPRAAISTTINTALVTGNVPSGNTSFGATGNVYGGGAEALIRLQEDWRTQNFVYYGSMVQLYRSVQANTAGSAGGQFFKAPATTRWFYDYETFSDFAPPGDMMIAAYLQQQRWYQVY
jgi:hypothetical protein